MLVVLTALVILPDDLAGREIASYQSRLIRRVANIGEAIAGIREQIAQEKDELQKFGTNEESLDKLGGMLAKSQSKLDELLIYRDIAERAELRGVPFAGAVWRVRAAPKR